MLPYVKQLEALPQTEGPSEANLGIPIGAWGEDIGMRRTGTRLPKVPRLQKASDTREGILTQNRRNYSVFKTISCPSFYYSRLMSKFLSQRHPSQLLSHPQSFLELAGCQSTFFLVRTTVFAFIRMNNTLVCFTLGGCKSKCRTNTVMVTYLFRYRYITSYLQR